MAPKLEVNPANVRAGAGKVSAAKTEIAGIQAPDAAKAASGLMGFGTAGALLGVKEAVADSLSVVGGRYDELGQLIGRAVGDFERADQRGLDSNGRQAKLTDRVSAAMGSVGDMNSAT